MSTPTETQQWILTNKPTDLPKLSGSDPTFTKKTTALASPLPTDHVLLRTKYISNDPAQRGWISNRIDPKRLYVPPVQTGDPMRARAVAEILESTSSDAKFAKGKLVLASTNWSEYVVLPAKDCQPAPPLPGGLSETHYLGALGLTGLTAYYGLAEVAAAKKDDVVVVSGAAGATGCMVVQIAKKMLGCKRVIGVAGGPDKCAWVTQQMGADACVDYKSPDLKSQLVQALDGAYADVFFDNVAGEVLDVMFTLMAQHGRIAQCGAISGYNAESDPYHMKNYFYVVSQRIKVEGFIVLDAVQKPGWAAGTIGKFQEAVKEGRLKLTNDMETVVDAKFDEVPSTWMRLFEGKNQGKLVTKLVQG